MILFFVCSKKARFEQALKTTFLHKLLLRDFQNIAGKQYNLLLLAALKPQHPLTFLLHAFFLAYTDCGGQNHVQFLYSSNLLTVLEVRTKRQRKAVFVNYMPKSLE